jgi:hypothetical protein
MAGFVSTRGSFNKTDFMGASVHPSGLTLAENCLRQWHKYLHLEHFANCFRFLLTIIVTSDTNSPDATRKTSLGKIQNEPI